jgi:hypothetical protein
MSISPESMLDAIRDTIEFFGQNGYAEDYIIRHGETVTGDDIRGDLQKIESTLYLLCESRKVRPLCNAPAGFESLSLPILKARAEAERNVA